MVKRLTKACDKRLPAWDDDAKLSNFVVEVIADPRNAAECDPYLRPWRTGPRITSNTELFAATESAAIKAAKRGDPGPLANLLDHLHRDKVTLADYPYNPPLAALLGHPPGKQKIHLLELPMSFARPMRRKPYTPSPEAAALIAEYLRGERRRDLRNKPDDDETRFYNSVRYRAGRHAELVELILRRHYPNETTFRDRAITIVARLRNIERSTIENYFKAIGRL